MVRRMGRSGRKGRSVALRSQHRPIASHNLFHRAVPENWPVFSRPRAACGRYGARSRRAHFTLDLAGRAAPMRADPEIPLSDLVLWLDKLRLADPSAVAAKCLPGRNDRQPGPTGCIGAGRLHTTAHAFQQFIAQSGLAERIPAAPGRAGRGRRRCADQAAGDPWLGDRYPAHSAFDAAVRAAYAELCARAGGTDVKAVAVPPATAEDPAGCELAGQRETFLNVSESADEVIPQGQEVFALYNDRAIAYPRAPRLCREEVFLSAGVQLMVPLRRGAPQACCSRLRHRIGLPATPSSSRAATAWARWWCRAP